MRTIMKLARCALGALLAVAGLSEAAQMQAPVRVIAWARNVGCEVQYIYVVQNNGPQPIRRLLIGLYQPDEGNGAADLSTLPRLNGKSLWIAPWYTKSPSGWNVKASFPEESAKFALEWIESGYHAELWPAAPAIPLPATSARTGKPVLPRTTVQDFSVMIPQPDAGYLQGRANIDYGDLSLNVQIEKGDTIAPTLDLQVRRMPRFDGQRWTEFEITPTVKDNFDGAPELAQPKVVSNQKLPGRDVRIEKVSAGWKISLRNISGRAYQVQLVATDASGNTTMRTVDYVSASGSPK